MLAAAVPTATWPEHLVQQ